MRERRSLILRLLLFGLSIGAVWQIYDVVNAFINNWDYAFPFMLLVVSGQARWIVLDFWAGVIITCALVREAIQ